MHPLLKTLLPLWKEFLKSPEGRQMGLQVIEMDERPDLTNEDCVMVCEEATTAMCRWLVKNSLWN